MMGWRGHFLDFSFSFSGGRWKEGLTRGSGMDAMHAMTEPLGYWDAFHFLSVFFSFSLFLTFFLFVQFFLRYPHHM